MVGTRSNPGGRLFSDPNSGDESHQWTESSEGHLLWSMQVTFLKALVLSCTVSFGMNEDCSYLNYFQRFCFKCQIFQGKNEY